MSVDSYGVQPEPGEVAELVKKLRYQAAAYSAYPDNVPLIEEWARCFTRAAIAADRAQCQPAPEEPTRRQLLQLAAEFWSEGCEPAQAVPFARPAHP